MKMEKGNFKFLKIYYWIVIIEFLIGLLISLYARFILSVKFPEWMTINAYALFTTIFSSFTAILLFVLSIFVIFNFTKRRFPAITLIWPIYVVLATSLSLIILGVYLVVTSSWVLPNSFLDIIGPVSKVISWLGIILSLYILYKFR